MNKHLILVTVSIFMSAVLFSQSDADVDKKIESILSQLTLQEKVAMCHAQSKFSTRGVERLGIPEVWMSDGPHGVRAEINWDDWGYAGWTNDSITAFPALTCLAATFNPELAGKYGFAVGEEARYRKKDVLLGPGVNIYRTPLNGRNFEYMGEDPFLASTMVVPYIKGVQKSTVAACVKHFALNNQEKWRGHINVNISDRALHEIYLPAYKSAVTEGGTWAIMGAYNKYNKQWCCHNEILLNKILKQDWGFNGVVISDWSGAHNTMESALYGLDMEMGTMTNGMTDTEKYAYDNYNLAQPFYKLLKDGTIEEAVVDDKVRRILRLMLRTNMAANRPMGNKNTKAHQEVARKIAVDGIVLLKNEDNFFPVVPESNMTIAVIGENATKSMTIGGGSSELKAQYEISPLEGIKTRYKNAKILHAMGYASGPSAYARVIPSKLDADSLFNAAVKAAEKADIVLFVGGLNKNHHQDCEGGDRLGYGLPFGQEKLIKKISEVNPNLGLILVSGNAVSMPWLKNVKAVLQSWYLGSEAGNAIADMISGDVNPSGKLPFTFPVKLKDNAAHHFGELSYPGDSIDQYYKEGILVGYRWHDTKKIKPQFAFGHGLTYTNFEIEKIKADRKNYASGETIRISCSVSNTGDRDGSEVVQVYVGKPGSKVERALKELKGFRKVRVNSGESEQIQVDVPVNDLSFYNESTSEWELEKGNYILYVGNASDQISKKLNVNVE